MPVASPLDLTPLPTEGRGQRHSPEMHISICISLAAKLYTPMYGVPCLIKRIKLSNFHPSLKQGVTQDVAPRCI